MKISELISTSSKKGYILNTEYKNMIGIMFRKCGTQWHWFKIFGEDVYFDHTYSMNTGRSFKGMRHGWKIEDKINGQK